MIATTNVLDDPTLMSRLRDGVSAAEASDKAHTFIEEKCPELTHILEAMERGMGNAGLAGFIFIFSLIQAASEIDEDVTAEFEAASVKFNDHTWVNEQLQELVNSTDGYIAKAENLVEVLLKKFSVILHIVVTGMPRDDMRPFRRGVLICMALYFAALKDFHT